MDYECTVYYADGAGEEGGGGEEEGGEGEGGDPQPGDLTPATFVGQATAEILGSQVAFNWSITRNADKTLTFEISWDNDIEGCVPQICIADQFSTMPFEGHKAKFTTKDKYNDGDAFSGFFYIAYVGNAARIDIVGYIIGKSNTEEGGGEGGSEEGGGEGGEEGGGEEPGDEAFESIESSNLQILKFVEDGTLYILRDGKIYTVNGQIIK